MTTTVHEHHHTASDPSGAAWAVLAIVLLGILIIGGLYFSGFFSSGVGTTEDSDINIDLPQTEDILPDTEPSY